MLFALIISALAITDKEIIQQALNGVFQQNHLPDPTTIVPCLDDKTAHDIVVFVPQVLDKAAKGSIKDLIGLKDFVQNFVDSIDPKVKACLDDNAQLQTLNDKYPFDEHTQEKLISFVTLHYLTVHKWLVDIDDTWHKGDYYHAGWKGAQDLHTMLKISQK